MNNLLDYVFEGIEVVLYATPKIDSWLATFDALDMKRMSKGIFP